MSSHIRNKLNKQKYNQSVQINGNVKTTVYNRFGTNVVDRRYVSADPNRWNYMHVQNLKKGTINPIIGNRKDLSCCTIFKPLYQNIYKDNYSNCNGGLCKQPIVRSGMQHKTIAENFFTRDKQEKEIKTLEDNIKKDETELTRLKGLAQPTQEDTANIAKLDITLPLDRVKLADLKSILKAGYVHKKVEYSYSYREYMKNKKNITYENKQQTFNKQQNNLWTSSVGNCDDNKCNKTTWKPNNDKFKVQGAVSSSSRLTRVKLDAIQGSSRCKKNPTKCNGVYFAGKPRWTGWMFNETHHEINFPQMKARRRTFSLWNNRMKQNKNVRIYSKNDCKCKNKN